MVWTLFIDRTKLSHCGAVAGKIQQQEGGEARSIQDGLTLRIISARFDGEELVN